MSKNILAEERKAKKRKTNKSHDEPKLNKPWKQYKNKGVSKKGNRRTKWTPAEDQAVRQIHGHVTWNNASWKKDNLETWSKQTDDKEGRNLYTVLSTGSLNDKNTYRSPQALITRFNKLKQKGFNDNTDDN